MMLLEVADSFVFLHLPILPRCWDEESFASICGLLRLQNGKQTARFRNLSSSISAAPFRYRAPKLFCGEPPARRNTCA